MKIKIVLKLKEVLTLNNENQSCSTNYVLVTRWIQLTILEKCSNYFHLENI
jgi:hypothetical protein